MISHHLVIKTKHSSCYDGAEGRSGLCGQIPGNRETGNHATQRVRCRIPLPAVVLTGVVCARRGFHAVCRDERRLDYHQVEEANG